MNWQWDGFVMTQQWHWFDKNKFFKLDFVIMTLIWQQNGTLKTQSGTDMTL